VSFLPNGRMQYIDSLVY